jgi:hypothetical protein
MWRPRSMQPHPKNVHAWQFQQKHAHVHALPLFE